MDPRLFPEGNLREISLGLQGKVLTGCPVFVFPYRRGPYSHSSFSECAHYSGVHRS